MRMYKVFIKKTVSLLIVMVALCFFAAEASGCGRDSNISSVSADVFSEDIKSGDVQLVDVRTAEEFGAGHIGGAINIDVQSPDFQERVGKELKKDKTVYVYCRSGRRSLAAAEILADHGFKVVNLKGGIIEWSEDGKPVVSGGDKQ